MPLPYPSHKAANCIKPFLRVNYLYTNPFPPIFLFFGHNPLTVDGSIIQHNHCGLCNFFLEYSSGKCASFFTSYGLFAFKTGIFAARRNHSKYIKTIFIRAWNKNIFIRKLPSVRDIYTYVGTIKGRGVSVSRHLWTLTQKVACAKLYTTKLRSQPRIYSMTRFYPLFAAHNMGIIRMLTDRGTEYCGKVEAHDYELYLGVSGIEHTKDQKLGIPRPTGYANASTRPFSTNFIGSPFGRRFINLLRSYRPIWING